jgi:hypothetical protein
MYVPDDPPTSCTAVFPLDGAGEQHPVRVEAGGTASGRDRVDDVVIEDGCFVVLCTSMSGASPVTVSVSSSAPTCISAFTVALNDPLNSIPSRFTVEKPASEKVTL